MCQNLTMRNQNGSGFFIINLEHVYNWVPFSISDNDQVKAAGKDINV